MGLVNLLSSLVSVKRLSRFLGLSEVQPVLRQSVNAIAPAATDTTTGTAAGGEPPAALTEMALRCSLATGMIYDRRERGKKKLREFACSRELCVKGVVSVFFALNLHSPLIERLFGCPLSAALRVCRLLLGHQA
jgi:hypothetical protein